MEKELRSIGVIQKDLLRSRTEPDVAQILTDALVSHFDAFFARVWLTRRGDICNRCQLADNCPDKQMCLHLMASSGYYTHTDGGHTRVPLGAFKIGLIAQGRGKTISNDVVHDPRVHNHQWAQWLGLKSFAGFPLVLDERVVGVMAMFSRKELPDHLLTTLELLADLVASALDNVHRRQFETELAQARKLESIGQLAAGIAHEINTPLQFLSDNVEFLNESSTQVFEVADTYQRLLEQCDDPIAWEERRQQMTSLLGQTRFEQIRRQFPEAIVESRDGIRRVIEIVRAMRLFSHPGAKQDGMVPTDLNEAVRSTLVISKNRWKYVADADAILDSDLPLTPVLAAEINQVLLNLVVNAADAIAEKVGTNGTERGLITIRTRADDDWVMVEVEDTGCGIPESIRAHIFEPFFTTKDVGQGTGQGLSICHQVVVNQHHGSLEMNSTPGQGSCFRVKLPRRSPADVVSSPQADIMPSADREAAAYE